MDILTKSDQWWEARTADGKKGSEYRDRIRGSPFADGIVVAPSNYLKLVTGRLDTVVEIDATPSAAASPIETEPTAIASIVSESQEVYPFKAEALFGCEFVTSLTPIVTDSMP